MSNCLLNDILSTSDNFNSFSKNHLLDNLAIPNNIYIRNNKYSKLAHPIIYNKNSCIDDTLFNKFINLVEYNPTSLKKITRSANKKRKIKKTRKTKN